MSRSRGEWKKKKCFLLTKKIREKGRNSCTFGNLSVCRFRPRWIILNETLFNCFSLFTYIWAITMSFYICDTRYGRLYVHSARFSFSTCIPKESMKKSGMSFIVRLFQSRWDYRLIRLSTYELLEIKTWDAWHRTILSSTSQNPRKVPKVD